ncbi:hypothetical protein LTR86_007745 [Recurvomyces mirabilis]|nr:hypothetical protein LTR86_007745 [Recurvomyces mirabilis]
MAPFHFGTLVYNYQAVDVVGPFDLCLNASKFVLQYIVNHGVEIDKKTMDNAPEFVFHHIGDSSEPLKLMTGGYVINRTTSPQDCPEVIGGPIPEDFSFPESYNDFIRKHVAAGKLVFTTCTGASALATTGALDGKSATCNHIEFNWVKKAFPKVKWTNEKQWVVDGNIWTGSGAIAGMDMMAHWIKETYGFEYMRLAGLGLDYEPRDVDGLFTVLPKRFDANGKQISSHAFPK